MGLFLNFTILLFIVITLVSIFAFINKNHSLILLCYLISAFKLNVLDEANISFLEPQLIIGIIWIFSIRYGASSLFRKDYFKYKYFVRLLIVFFIFEILFSLKQAYVFNVRDIISVKTFIKLLVDFLVVYTLIRYRYILNISQKTIIYGTIMGSVYIGLQSVLAYNLGYTGKMGIEMKTGERIAGLMKYDLNELTVLLNISMLFFLHLFIQKRIKSYVVIPAVGIQFAAVLLTGSRSGLFGSILIALFYILSMKQKNKNARFYVKNIFFAALIIFVGYILLGKYGSTTVNRMESEEMDENVRVLRWDEYKSYFKKNPDFLLFGAFEEIKSPLAFRRAVHNFYIQKVYDFGIFYLLMILFLFYKIGKHSHPYIKYYLLLFLYSGMTLSILPLGYMPFIIFFFNHYSQKNTTIVRK